LRTEFTLRIIRVVHGRYVNYVYVYEIKCTGVADECESRGLMYERGYFNLKIRKKKKKAQEKGI